MDAGLAAILNSTTPIFAFLLTVLITHHEPVTGRKLFGVVIGIAGTCLIIGIEAFHGLGDELPARGRRSSFQIATLQVPISAPLSSNQPRTRFVERRAEEAAAIVGALLSSARLARLSLRKTTPTVEGFIDALQQNGLKKFGRMLRQNIASLD
ncbi:drug/metabolite transporter (DMT)-like permease [Rhizobium mongolense]|uniref:Drug/metabolite transporter (DMT)-like permease n=1 Tax=Rhizobium mongolense TaxID=57676 RepID=A0A7W6RUN1_9HYPH|nr:drug/metabolite transporter (DMT)-like permease [Rhizobium mongolense]